MAVPSRVLVVGATILVLVVAMVSVVVARGMGYHFLLVDHPLLCWLANPPCCQSPQRSWVQKKGLEKMTNRQVKSLVYSQCGVLTARSQIFM
jgi:hypothetical protein